MSGAKRDSVKVTTKEVAIGAAIVSYVTAKCAQQADDFGNFQRCVSCLDNEDPEGCLEPFEIIQEEAPAVIAGSAGGAAGFRKHRATKATNRK